MKKLYYTAKITVEVKQGTDDEVCDQLDAVILPAAHDLTWVLSGLSDFPTPHNNVEGLIDNFEEALLRNEYAETDSGDTYTALKEARDALKAALLSSNSQA